MGILQAQCDRCGKIDETVEYDNDGIYRCEKCHIENELVYLENRLRSQTKWIRDVWIKQLKEMRQSIKELKEKFESLD
jgi:ribosomal protein L37AE/L43A